MHKSGIRTPREANAVGNHLRYTRQHELIGSLPDGDILVHAGDFRKSVDLRFLTKAEKLRGYIAHR